MKIAFKVVFLKGPKVVAEIIGDAKGAEDLTVAEVTENVIATEQFLEKLTGHRVHIEQIH
jgi:hypothetical protein